jgi:hypothetical protein
MLKRFILFFTFACPLWGFAQIDLHGQAHEALRQYVRLFPQYTDAYETYGDGHVRAMVDLYEAKRWGEISEEIFLNAILPPVSLREHWVDWRPTLQPLAEALVKEAKTPLEGAMLLNGQLWKQIDVVYSTQRDFPNQDPLHSIRINKASCSGLSILLVDACRSVGIPARVVGCLWRKKPGNHTWVEIYSQGTWYPLGAFDSNNPHDLWFAQDAAQADGKSARYAIYATRLLPSSEDLRFYGWNVPAENVTAHYVKETKDASSAHLIRIHIAAERGGQRVAVPVEVNGERALTPGPLRDLNDFATFLVPPGETVTFTLDGKTVTRPLRPDAIFVEPLMP